MKKLLISLLLTTVIFNFAEGQSNIYFENEAPEANFTLDQGPLLETSFFVMTNTNEDTIVVDWIISIDIPQVEVPYNAGEFRDAWLVLVCDEVVCHSAPNAQSVIPPQESYNWKLNISGAGFLGYELTPGEGTATFEAIDTLKQEQVARYTATIKITDTSINIENFYEDKVSVYPSPANDFVNISISENTAINQVSVNNLTGADLFNRQINLGNNFEKIDINKQPKGLYMLVFKDENGKPLYQKLINKK